MSQLYEHNGKMYVQIDEMIFQVLKKTNKGNWLLKPFGTLPKSDGFSIARDGAQEVKE